MNEENNTIPTMENTNQIPSAPEIPNNQAQTNIPSAPVIETTIPAQPEQVVKTEDVSLPTLDEVLTTQSVPVAPPIQEQPKPSTPDTFIQPQNISTSESQQISNNTQMQNKPTPTIDPNSDIYIRGPVEKVKKGNGARTFVLLAVLVVCVIIFWPKIETSLTKIGLIKENNSIQNNENNSQNTNNNQNNNNEQNTNEENKNESSGEESITTTPPEDSKLPTNKPSTETETKPSTTTKPSASTETKPSTSTETKPSTSTTTSWNGVYTKGNTTIKIYKVSSDEINYVMTGDSYVNGSAEISGSKAVNDSFGDTTTLTLNANTLTITSNDDFVEPGTYTRKSDYTKNDYYEDNIGEIKYATSNINGIFKKDNVTIKIYQTEANEGRISITKQYSSYSKPFDIVNGKIHLEDEFFDDIEKIDAEINGSTLTITASDTDEDGLLNEISGTYSKTSSYSIDDIIKDNSW